MAPLTDRDGAVLLLAKSLRTFAYGLLTVSLAIYLAQTTSFTTTQIGLILSSAILGGLTSTTIVVLLADRFGRRRTLTILSLLTALAGTVLLATSSFWLIALGLFLGSLSLTGGETGPFLSIEQSIIPQISPEAENNRAFSIYNFIGYIGLSTGSLAGTIPSILEQRLGYTVRASYLPVFATLVLVGLILAFTYQALGLRVEAVPSAQERRLSIPNKSRRVVRNLSILFGLDSFGGGFVIQSIIALWFFLRFNTELSSLGLIIAAGQVTTAISVLAAGRLADKLGLLKTMVYSHLASNLLLASTAFAPTLQVAVVLYLSRQSLSQMDVPTRQAYTMALVPEDERTPAAGITTLSRNLSQSISPSLAGYLLEALKGFLGAPFILGGSIKIAYDLLLYKSFRNVPLSQPEQD